MKVILFENTLVSLENFFSAKVERSGNIGTQKNPCYHYGIKIRYVNSDQSNYLNFDEDKKLAEEWLNKIFKTLAEKEG